MKTIFKAKNKILPFLIIGLIVPYFCCMQVVAASDHPGFSQTSDPHACCEEEKPFSQNNETTPKECDCDTHDAALIQEGSHSLGASIQTQQLASTAPFSEICPMSCRSVFFDALNDPLLKHSSLSLFALYSNFRI